MEGGKIVCVSVLGWLVFLSSFQFHTCRKQTACREETLELREEHANVVISGTVREIIPDSNGDKMYKSGIEVKRVFKGNSIVDSVTNFEDPVSRHKMLMVEGFGDSSICDSEVRPHDTRIFLLNKGSNGALKLNSSIVPITLVNLEYTDALVKGRPYKVPEQPEISPCQHYFCAFGAKCFVNKTDNSAYCQCHFRCKPVFAPVCGSDGVTYSSECLLLKSSCITQRRIKLSRPGECDPCEGFHSCKSPEVCQLDKQRRPVCRCNFVCAQELEPVCGNDGRTYSNRCVMRKEACKARKEIDVLYPGQCSTGSNPCDKIRCGPEEECSIDRSGEASCVCPPPCEPIVRRVCGNDSQTYDSECELHRQSCLSKIYVTVTHTGPCGPDVPCKDYKCTHHAICVPQDGRPTCRCPTCSEQYSPICGKNGISYESECKLRQENCERKTNVKIKHRGTCNQCENVRCEFYSICESDGSQTECVCPNDCVDVDAKVCGSDGRTYLNECELKVAACRDKKFISITSIGDCDSCADKVCKYGAKCEHGTCLCPILCPTIHEPICASDGRTYSNECEMRRTACSRQSDLYVVRSGECDDDGIEMSGSGDGFSGDSMLSCDESTCRFGGKCVLDGDELYKCTCNFNCAAVRSPVCGSDGRTYGNKCHLKFESCQTQKEISIQIMDNCDIVGSEEPCDGSPPLINPATGHDYKCSSSGKGCPASSYCDSEFKKCCREETQIQRCSDSQYGCCQDHQTASPGPKGAGCPEFCHCNPVGSYSNTCDQQSHQCSCKPGVGGLRCDRCKSGYWGLHLIVEKGNTGCIPCNCNPFGATRDDCDQMTGRCMCKSNINGMKCNMCHDKKLLGPLGCEVTDIPSSCSELECQFGAVCQDFDGRLECVCEVRSCEMENGQEIVCGTDGQNYGSECQLRLFGCRLQKYISVAYRGPCRALPSTETTTPVPSTTRSRKTTRHIKDNAQAPSGEIKTGGTDQPEADVVCEGLSKIDELCIDDDTCCANNSQCHLGLCHCLPGFVPSMDMTQCIEVKRDQPPKHLTNPPNRDACTENPCHHHGTCVLDDSLGFRCICPLSQGGPFCRTPMEFETPSFSGKSYLTVPAISKANKDLSIEVVFHTLNKDGILLFNAQNKDGTGDFIALIIKDGYVQFRYNLGGGEVVIRSTVPIEPNKSHRVVARRVLEKGFLVMDNEAAVTGAGVHTHNSLSLRDPLYVGYVPNASDEVYNRIGVRLGLVGCVKSLKAGNRNYQREYHLRYPDPNTNIIDGAGIGKCGNNPCNTMPCVNDGTCIMQDENNFLCMCSEGYQGIYCEDLKDPCSSQPCQFGGTCISTDFDTGFHCQCAEDRDGLRCEKESMKRVFVPQFAGESYLEFGLNISSKHKLRLEVWIRATKPNGVIMFATQFPDGQGDYISINLIKRKLEFKFYLGSGTAKLESRGHIHLKKWHRVVVEQSGQNGKLQIDHQPLVTGRTPGTSASLNLGKHLYIGGYNKKSDLPPSADITSPFTGAIQKIVVNGKIIDNLMTSAKHMRNIEEYDGPPCNMNPCLNGGICIPKLNEANCRCPGSFIGERCEKKVKHVNIDQPVKFDGTTFLHFLNEISIAQEAQRTNNIQIRFRTKNKNGLLAFQNRGDSVKGDYLAIAIVNGKVQFSYNLGKQAADNLFIIESKVKVDDDKWHKVTARRELQDGILQVDDEVAVMLSSAVGASQLDTDGQLWIGGKSILPWDLPSAYYQGFVGCVDEIKVNRGNMHLVKHRTERTMTVAFCS
ncbi:agrin-like isoform X2 [Gigantopelta aegis]|uniref:agrin-like isoform X2 n=1 Tax=Gigantopelta aegis TaxID=1735272 RepID=UPI001B88DEDC|nr:agrin-like isoform X2 [Gigantopelta aegis]